MFLLKNIDNHTHQQLLCKKRRIKYDKLISRGLVSVYANIAEIITFKDDDNI